MRSKLAAMMVAFGLAVSACAGSGGSPSAPSQTGPTGSTPPSSEPQVTAEPTTTPEPEATVLTSDDGLLSVTIPPGAAEGVDVTITQSEEVPSELAALDIRGKFYELGPDGTQFEVPVTITRIVDPKTAGFDLSLGIPAIVLASRDADGSWEWLDAQTVVFDGSRLVATATTTHFSTVTAFGGAVLVRLEPGSVALEVGETFKAGFAVFGGSGLSVDVGVSDYDPFATGSIAHESAVGSLEDFPDLLSSSGGAVDTFVCAAPGDGPYGFKAEIQEELEGINAVLVDAVAVQVTIAGEGHCRAKASSGPVGVTGAVFCVKHQRFEGHPSNVNGTFGLFGPDGLLGGTLIAKILGANGDRPFDVPISADGVGVYQVGIDAYGPKVFESFLYQTPDGTKVDLTAQTQDVLGTSVVVGPTEGVLAGDGVCPY